VAGLADAVVVPTPREIRFVEWEESANALGQVEGAIGVAGPPEQVGLEGGDQAKPSPVFKPQRDGLGLVETLTNPVGLRELEEGVT
jgi:hypothetical protein